MFSYENKPFQLLDYLSKWFGVFKQEIGMLKKLTLVSLLAFIFTLGCTTKDQMKKTLEENPEILTNAIEKNPKLILDALNKAVEQVRNKQKLDQVKNEEKALEEEFKAPKKPVIEANRVISGPKDAPITIVEYSDFECPFCKKGYKVVNQVKEEYGSKVRVIYKHLPLSFHKMAEPASRYYEAIALQSHNKAQKFHDLVFEDQMGLQNGEAFLKKMAKKVGANVSKATKDSKSAQVTKIINADKAEAEKYGFTGTPGFLINGVSVKGAFPFSHFKKIIDKHLEAK